MASEGTFETRSYRNSSIKTALQTEDDIVYERLSNEDALLQLLKNLQLNDKYPGKIRRSDLYKITKSSLFRKKPQCHGELARYFLETIVQYNYKARDLRIDVATRTKASLPQATVSEQFARGGQQTLDSDHTIEIHPLDILVAVFLCCDNIARQDLASHLWNCRLAVPLVVQIKPFSELPSCFIWPLRGLVMRWETTIDGRNEVREGRLVKEIMPAIAFVRFGDISISKSSLINKVISNSEKAHPIFMHRNSPGSVIQRLLVNGMIDIGWYFPTSQSTSEWDDHFQDAMMFLNLHGDASGCHMRNQVKFLLSVAKVFVIVATANKVCKSKELLTTILEHDAALLLVLSDMQISSEDHSGMNDLLKNFDHFSNKVYYLRRDIETKVSLIEKMRSIIKEHGRRPFSCLQEIINLDVCATIDERDARVFKAKKDADGICDAIFGCTTEKRKKTMHLPLQGELWKKYAQADKEKLRLTNKRHDEDPQEYMAERKKVMKQCRSKQLEIIKEKGSKSLVERFVKSMDNKSDDELMLFLQFLKFSLDDRFQEKRDVDNCRHEEDRRNLLAPEDERKEELRRQVDDLDKDATSFGLQHLLREMGQLFEASFQGANMNTNQDKLPKLAAKIALGGEPFELLDGTVNSVPLTWVKTVLLSVRDMLAEKRKTQKIRVKVISTLGIQSSGKSTMLNYLFGCHYAVSAGRCTQGAHCQFIEVEESFADEIGIDCVIVIDTEGMRCPEFSVFNQMITHDNELSAFVIGLADISILSIMGENTTHLDEILPVSVNAFLRMEMASNIKPRCIIVHQNVNNEDRHKFLQQGKVLEGKLNTQTKAACSIEGRTTRTFQEVIQFDVKKDVFYISMYCEGRQPMAPVSPAYSQELNNLKQKLLMDKDSVKSKSFDSFVEHLENLWSCIIRDDFVYQFRNTIETEARRKLDNYWCDADWKFRQPISDMLSNCYTEMQNCGSEVDLFNLKNSKESEIKGQVEKNWQQQVSELETFINTADKIMTDAMQNLQREMLRRFDELRVHTENEIKTYLTECYEDKMNELALRKEIIRYKDNIRKEIEQSIQDLRSASIRHLSEQDISQLFETKWLNWKSEVMRNNPRRKTTVNLNNDAYESIRSAFPNDTGTLNECTRKKPIDQYDYVDFKSSELLTKSQKMPNNKGNRSKTDALEDAVAILFDKIDEYLNSSVKATRPYAREDIDSVVMLSKEYFVDNKTVKTSKQQVDITVIVCGHSIKHLKKNHDNYEKQTDPETLLEREKEHLLRVFQSMYSETETLQFFIDEFRKMITVGLQEKITRTLPDQLLTDIINKHIEFSSKSMILYSIMLEGARQEQFNDLLIFVNTPCESILNYICRCIREYSGPNDIHFKSLFQALLQKNKDDIALGLARCNQAKSIIEWLEIVKTNMENVIILRDMVRIAEVCQGREIDMKTVFDKARIALHEAAEDILNDAESFFERNRVLITDHIETAVFASVVGCMESCPFCGALCMRAHRYHEGDHSTTLHRPRGCNQWHDEDTKFLETETCPMGVASRKKCFHYWKQEKELVCSYKKYRSVYPDWHIQKDETGEDSSFWNWFFAAYAEQLAGEDLKVPDIPASWKELTRDTEIKKLEDKIELNRTQLETSRKSQNATEYTSR